MKYVKLLLLLLLFAGCNNHLTQEQKKQIKATRTKISCFTPEGWKDFWPRNHDSFWKGGWNFYDIEGVHMQSSMCQRKTKIKVK